MNADGKKVTHLLLYYRYLAKLIFTSDRSPKDRHLNLKEERKLFEQLESTFHHLIDNKSDQIHKLASITPNSDDAFLLAKLPDQSNNSDKLISVTELVMHVQNLLGEIDGENETTKVNGHGELLKTKENEVEAKELRSSSTTRTVQEMKQIIEMKNAQESDNSSKNRPRTRSSSASRNRKRKEISAEFVYSDDEANVGTIPGQNDPEFMQPSSNSDSESEKAWALRANRPRRACTINSTSASPEKKVIDVIPNKKTKITTNSIDKIKTLLKRKIEGSSKSGSNVVFKELEKLNESSNSEATAQSNRSVEELVVNCDPFSLFNHEDSIDNYPKSSNLARGPTPTPVSGHRVVGNKVIIPINNHNQIMNKQMAPSVTQANASVSIMTSGSTPISRVPSTNLAGKSLGKVLMINSVPFLIRNGDKLHIPMLTDDNSANQLVRNLTMRANQSSGAPTLVNSTIQHVAPNSSLLNIKSSNRLIPNSSNQVTSTLSTPVIKREMESDEYCKVIQLHMKQASLPLKKRRGRPPNSSRCLPLPVVPTRIAPAPVSYMKSSMKSSPLLPAPVGMSSPVASGSCGKLMLVDNVGALSQTISSSPSLNVALLSAQSSVSSGSMVSMVRNPTDINIGANRKWPSVSINPIVSNNSPSGPSGNSIISKSTISPNILSKKSLSMSMREQLKRLRMKANLATNQQPSNELTINKNTSSSPTSSQATCSKSTSLPKAPISEAEIIALARRKGLGGRIVPPLRPDNEESPSRESVSTETTNQMSSLKSAMDISHSKYKQSKAELYSKLKKGRYCQMIDPNNKNVLLYRNEVTNTIMGYKCNFEQCPGFVSPRKDKLLLHIRCRHTGSKPFICPDCSKPFAIANYLALHRRLVHSGERPFRCTTPGCRKRFKLRKSLKGHMARHFYEKPFVCKHPGCVERFIYSYELKEHQVVHQYVFGPNVDIALQEKSSSSSGSSMNANSATLA